MPEKTDSPRAASPANAGIAMSDSAAAAPATAPRPASNFDVPVFDTGKFKERAAAAIFSMICGHEHKGKQRIKRVRDLEKQRD